MKDSPVMETLLIVGGTTLALLVVWALAKHQTAKIDDALARGLSFIDAYEPDGLIVEAIYDGPRS